MSHVDPVTVLMRTLDVTDRESVFCVVEEGRRHFGRLDVIVSNAGYSYMGAVEELDFDEARANFDINVFGTLSVL
jgi:NAD(P)-dependent dehydrogenase (short-subunit alcohol dehydrogenase family)